MRNPALILLIPVSMFFNSCVQTNSQEKVEITLTEATKTTNGYVLPTPSYDSRTSVEQALKNRRSHRSFKGDAISSADLGQVLWAAYGLTNPLEGYPQTRGGLRTAPSAGATYPLEIYALVQNVKDIAPGVYRYNSKDHTLIFVSDQNKKPDLCKAALNQEMIEEAPACLFFSAVYERTVSKYGDRAINRYVCMDLGHSAQNVYLQVETLGLGTCAIGAFNDEQVTQVMELPENETPLYIMPIGKYYEKSEF